MNQDIPKPITFNPVKHHLHYLKNKVKIWQKKDWKEAEAELRIIGNNLLDLYSGAPSVKRICIESLHYFHSKGIEDCDCSENTFT